MQTAICQQPMVLRLIRQILRLSRRAFDGTVNQFGRVLGIRLFSNCVKDVIDTWWGDEHNADCKDGLSICIDTVYRSRDNDDKWHCCPYWHRKLTNKLTAREFAIRYGVPVPALYWYGKDVDEIHFDELPSRYVIKTSFGTSSKHVIPIVDGKNAFTEKSCSPEWLRDFFGEIMRRSAPFGYLMIEEILLSESSDAVPNDLKCHVFDGKVHFFEMIDRLQRKLTWYTREWKQPIHDMDTAQYYRPGKIVERPADLDQLIRYAETLGQAYGHHYVRIDFYATNRGWVFGEFTATPSGGHGLTFYGNRVLGRLWAHMPNSRFALPEFDRHSTRSRSLHS